MRDSLKSLREKILLKRIDLDMTQEDLAAKADISPSTVSRFESGDTNNIGLYTLKRITDALDSHLSVKLSPTNQRFSVADESDLRDAINSGSVRHVTKSTFEDDNMEDYYVKIWRGEETYE